MSSVIGDLPGVNGAPEAIRTPGLQIRSLPGRSRRIRGPCLPAWIGVPLEIPTPRHILSLHLRELGFLAASIRKGGSMTLARRSLFVFTAIGCLLASVAAMAADIPLRNWAAPAYWSPPSGAGGGRTALTDAAAPMPYIPAVPCRQYDSRNTTALLDNTPRQVTLSGAPCGIPASAVAAAVNITVFDIVSNPGNAVFKVGTASPPTTAWINYGPTETQ